MKITIIQVGKTRKRYLQESENEYLKRLRPFAQVKIITAKEAGAGSGKSSGEGIRTQIREKEASEILKHIPAQSFVIALDERGTQINSPEFASFIMEKRDFHGGNLTFIIGGCYGLASSLLEKVDFQLSFSKFTFTHELIRTLLLEQLYRAFSILAGKTYHY